MSIVAEIIFIARVTKVPGTSQVIFLHCDLCGGIEKSDIVSF